MTIPIGGGAVREAVAEMIYDWQPFLRHDETMLSSEAEIVAWVDAPKWHRDRAYQRADAILALLPSHDAVNEALEKAAAVAEQAWANAAETIAAHHKWHLGYSEASSDIATAIRALKTDAAGGGV